MLYQKGIAHLFVLLLLLGGVVLGTFLIANRTNVVPNASEVSAPISPQPFPSSAKKCLSNSECDAGYECKTKDLKPLPADICKNSKNPNCEATMAAQKREAGTCHKIEAESQGGSGGMTENAGKVQNPNQNKPSAKPPKPVSRPN